MLAANRNNAAKSTGPKSEAGKQRSRLSALTHGLYVREVVLSNEDHGVLDALREDLQYQLNPSTPLQALAFDRLVVCAWNCSRAVRRQSLTLQDPDRDNRDPNGAPTAIDGEFWDGDRSDLRDRLKKLTWLRNEIEQSGLRRVDEWRGLAIRLLGMKFLDLLNELAPTVSEEPVLLGAHLASHEEHFGMPRQEAGTAMLLIEVAIQSCENLLDLRQGFVADASVAAEFAARYANRAYRELEKAWSWFMTLRENGY